MSHALFFLEPFHEVIFGNHRDPLDILHITYWGERPKEADCYQECLGLEARSPDCLSCSLPRHHTASPCVKVFVYLEIHTTPQNPHTSDSQGSANHREAGRLGAGAVFCLTTPGAPSHGWRRAFLCGCLHLPATSGRQSGKVNR